MSLFHASNASAAVQVEMQKKRGKLNLGPWPFSLPATMPSVTLGKKRPSEAIVENGVKPKKIKFGDDGDAKTVAPAPTISAPDEIDFPRGGGSSFTPLEQKAIRSEAIKEADADIFKVR